MLLYNRLTILCALVSIIVSFIVHITSSYRSVSISHTANNSKSITDIMLYANQQLHANRLIRLRQYDTKRESYDSMSNSHQLTRTNLDKVIQGN